MKEAIELRFSDDGSMVVLDEDGNELMRIRRGASDEDRRRFHKLMGSPSAVAIVELDNQLRRELERLIKNKETSPS